MLIPIPGLSEAEGCKRACKLLGTCCLNPAREKHINCRRLHLHESQLQLLEASYVSCVDFINAQLIVDLDLVLQGACKGAVAFGYMQHRSMSGLCFSACASATVPYMLSVGTSVADAVA